MIVMVAPSRILVGHIWTGLEYARGRVPGKFEGLGPGSKNDFWL